MTTDQAIKLIEKSIKNKRTPDTQWMEKKLAGLIAGTCDPTASAIEFHRVDFEARKKYAISETADLFDITGFLEKNIPPPRPQQTLLAMAASKHASIITLYGPSRTGKTTAAMRAALHVAVRACQPKICAINAVEMCDMEKDELKDLLARAKDSEVVVLDDIDKGTKGELMIGKVLQILSFREKQQFIGPVIITTNMMGPELAKQLNRRSGNPTIGPAILGRITDGICIDFGPPEIDFTGNLEAIRQKLIAMYPNDDDWHSFLDSFGRFKS